ncbi:TnsA endonuclease N-terminal domain-containing protein [Sulfurirhabdus autotrophica]|uniref:TnsA endonuclease-like protein n=1 Tax=Sulfurirhabdus autotrophica TaxID=1706046 RepID=A0A4R3XSV6_9PROT|nr:TnsA endonuclease N-terminal domain-containing protein [Sulfurirhabdus autotrophica]TCV81063.1 TnsA endonuclease-like protein [Sulfurirhabdus autotrophica]
MNTIEKNLRDQIKSGRGMGHGADYQPWLIISRRGSPSNGNMNYRHLPILGRHGHFLSRNEWHIALWVMWLGVEDLREQFPLWPFPHSHPLSGRTEMEQIRLPSSSGTLAIAKELGIAHGRFAGSNIPYFATTDLMLTVFHDGMLKAVAIAAKPADIVNGKVAAKPRVKERLILEMAYAKELGIRWLLLSNGEISSALRENLELAFPASILPDSLSKGIVVAYCGAITELLRAGLPVGKARQMTASKLNLDDNQANALFNHGLWWRHIPIDLRHPIIMRRPAKLTDFAWVKQSAEQILGGSHD